MKRLQILFVLSIIAIILSFIFLAFVLLPSILYERSSIPVRFIVAGVTGVDVDRNALSFGKIQPGNAMKREILISNNRNVSIDVSLRASSSVVDYISFERSIVIAPNEQMYVGVEAYIPPKTPFGNYSGFVTIRIKPQSE